MDARRDATVRGATATATAGGVRGPKLTVTMPLEAMVRGFIFAVRRYEEAVSRYHEAVSTERGLDVHIAMFEALAWIDALDERCNLAGDFHVRATRFARQRTHHRGAAPSYLNPAIGDWRWYKLELLPLGDRDDEAGERAYRKVLEERPVLETFKRVATVVRRLVPDADE